MSVAAIIRGNAAVMIEWALIASDPLPLLCHDLRKKTVSIARFDGAVGSLLLAYSPSPDLKRTHRSHLLLLLVGSKGDTVNRMVLDSMVGSHGCHWGRRGSEIDATVTSVIVIALLVQCNSGKIRIETSQPCFLLSWIC